MTDRPLRRAAVRLTPVALLALLVGAILVPEPGWLRLDNPDRTRATELRAALAALDDGAIVVVGFDPDLGTYPEIRPTVRTILADLLDRGARLAVVSFTAEGRALAIGELERLRSKGATDLVLDLGFRPGAEAALVSAFGRLLPDGAGGEIADAIAAAGGGVAAAEMAIIVGGNDLGPRSWVEQVRPRAPGLPLVAVAPTVQQPELQPYLASGQLEALLATIRDGAAYRAGYEPVRFGDVLEGRGLGALPVLVGVLVSLGVLIHAAGGPLLASRRSTAANGRSER